MKFFNLFRKKKEEKINEIENIPFEELTSWIELKALTLAKGKEAFTNLIKSRINQLSDELESGIEGLNKIDWEKIRADERIKNIIKDTLKNYIMHLQQLILDLITLEEVERIKIENIFTIFDKRAGKSYQKSTFLIGKELGVINKSISNLFKDLDKLQEENKVLLEHVEVISNIKKTLKESENMKNLILEVDHEIERINNKIKNLQLIMREMSTRKHHKGVHSIEVIINGYTFESKKFVLL